MRFHHVMFNGRVGIKTLVIGTDAVTVSFAISKGRRREAIAFKAIPQVAAVSSRLFNVQVTRLGVVQNIRFFGRKAHFVRLGHDIAGGAADNENVRIVLLTS